jgi:hypothetical protein
MTGQPPRAVVVTTAVLRASGRSRGPLLTWLAPREPWTIRGSHVEGCGRLPVCVPQRYHLNKAHSLFWQNCINGSCDTLKGDR